jgi:hypothetical protein
MKNTPLHISQLLIVVSCLCGFTPTTTEELQIAVDLWVDANVYALSTYSEINSCDVSLITNMSELFIDKTTFNDDIGN